MDINIALLQLGLEKNKYMLSNSAPPHEILEWYGPDDQPSEAELVAAWEEYEAEQQKTEYQRKRKAEYPPIEEQLDMLYEDMENGTTKWRDAVRAVKQKYPEPARGRT